MLEMDINNTHSHNQGYWFVLREDQGNVIFSSSNNFTIQNPNIPVGGQEPRYIVDTGERQFMINESPVVAQQCLVEHKHKEDVVKTKDDDNFWDKDKVRLLLTLCSEQSGSEPVSFRYNSSKDKPYWGEIASHLGTTPETCRKKYKILRRTYIRLLKKKRLGKDVNWAHYRTCEQVFKDCKLLPPAVLEPWEEHKVRRLLCLYLENLNKFRNPSGLLKDIWRDIALQLGTTEYNCYHKFKNLKRAYFNWKEKHRKTGKPIKWQYLHYFERIFYNYNPSIGPWDTNKTRLLMDAYKQIAEKFKNPRFQKKELWKEISDTVGESAASCDKKFRNLKQTYIRLKMRALAGKIITRWRYYKDFELIYSAQNDYTLHYPNDCTSKTEHKTHEQDYITELLKFYLENKERFKNPLLKKKSIWKVVGNRIGLSPEECDRKFRNLKQTYLRLAERKKDNGKSNNWPYYSYFEKIFDESSSLENVFAQSMDGMSLPKLQRVMQEMQDRKENDKFEVLVRTVEESNRIQRERNIILKALLDRQKTGMLGLNFTRLASPQSETALKDKFKRSTMASLRD